MAELKSAVTLPLLPRKTAWAFNEIPLWENPNLVYTSKTQ